MGHSFDVGGVLLDRPFRISRLGHVGVTVDHAAEARSFYRDLLGFAESDSIDFADLLPSEFLAPNGVPLPETRGYFMRYGSDHHSLVVFPKCVMDKVGRDPEGVTINQLTWQVGSLRQVTDARDWLTERGVPVYRAGRDMPGSNWHVYFTDPDRHVNELYYGMEQIGWDGLSKPKPLHDRIFHQSPPLPQMSELEEVDAARNDGVDLCSGTRAIEYRDHKYEVDGVMLSRPFKVVRLGPIGLFVADLETSTDFYVEQLGFTITETVDFRGHQCVYLRANCEHHSLALVPRALRDELPCSPYTTTAWIGLQIATYRQLRDAVQFLRDEGTDIIDIPSQLIPSIDYGAWVLDPAGHAFLLYFSMEPIGWDGRPRPMSKRPVPQQQWPETIPRDVQHYVGEPFLGPWG